MAITPQSYENTARIIDEVIRHASVRFARYGYKKTSVDEIAADVHISKRTLYMVFPSKEGILREAVWRQLMPAMSEFNRSVSSDLNPARVLVAFCRFIFADRRARGGTGHFGGLCSDDSYIRAAWLEAITRIIRDIIHEEAPSGEFRPIDCDLASETLAHILETALNHLDTASHSPDTIDQALAFIADILRV